MKNVRSSLLVGASSENIVRRSYYTAHFGTGLEVCKKGKKLKAQLFAPRRAPGGDGRPSPPFASLNLEEGTIFF